MNQKRLVIAFLAMVFLLSLVLVQWMEVIRRAEEAGISEHRVAIPASSRACVDCHRQTTPAIIEHWKGSGHAGGGVGCVDCHRAERADADAHDHYGAVIATIVTPRDCGRCHLEESQEFGASHHADAGNILASLDNFLAETVEGARLEFDPHSPTPGRGSRLVNGMASAASGCLQCHGSKIALEATDGGVVTVDDLEPDAAGQPTNLEALARIQRLDNGRPIFSSDSWPNTGIGRINLDGSLGSCSACHSRHDFSRRRARQPENCGKCHLGPDHPQKEIYEESKHGVAYRDLRDDLNLDNKTWVLGRDYAAAPTCATCHMSGHSRNGGDVTHDPGIRISWNNRPPVSLSMDTDANGDLVTVADPIERQRLTADTAQAKRNRMREVCSHCHTPSYVDAFYQQYDDLVLLYNEKFAKPGQMIIAALRAADLLTPTEFDEEIEWTWFYLWHHEGRRARHGAAMMAPDYTHWHGMFEVAERFYMELVPQARELAEDARRVGRAAEAASVERTLEELLARPEHAWFEQGALDQMEEIRRRMAERYGQGPGREGP
ncbi:MAG TPA: multiheme c-type cytochrome [Thermoanaerobaculia bacterium]|nr:multiheme c-type cytochrome [Thermoanaerobaculia bacterium]